MILITTTDKRLIKKHSNNNQRLTSNGIENLGGSPNLSLTFLLLDLKGDCENN